MILIDDLNRKLERTDYDAAIDALRDHLAKVPGFLAFGQFGEVSDPGISDLDVIIIVGLDSHSQIDEAISAWMAEDPIRTYLLPHPPVVLVPEMLPCVASHHTLYNVRWIQSHPELVIPGASDTQREYLELVWTGFLLTTAAAMLMQEEVGLRRMLLLTKNIHQSCENLAQLVGEPHPYKAASTYLRQAALAASRGDGDMLRHVEERFVEGLETLLGLIDRFGKIAGAPPNGLKPIAVNRRLFIRPAKESRIHCGHYRAAIWLNDSFLGIIAGSLGGRWQQAAKAYKLSERQIASLSAPSPFLTPFDRATHRPAWSTALLQALVALDPILETRIPVRQIIARKGR